LRIDHQLVTGDCESLDQHNDQQAVEIYRHKFGLPRWLRTDDEVASTTSLIPTMGLKQLVLTGVPSYSKGGWVAKGIQAFMNQCIALEELKASAGGDQGGKRTTLCKLVLEMQRAPSFDGQGFNFDEAIKDDFSFFDEAPSPVEGPQTSTLMKPWVGDVVEVLRKHRSKTRRLWSGEVVVVRPPAHA